MDERSTAVTARTSAAQREPAGTEGIERTRIIDTGRVSSGFSNRLTTWALGTACGSDRVIDSLVSLVAHALHGAFAMRRGGDYRQGGRVRPGFDC